MASSSDRPTKRFKQSERDQPRLMAKYPTNLVIDQSKRQASVITLAESCDSIATNLIQTFVIGKMIADGSDTTKNPIPYRTFLACWSEACLPNLRRGLSAGWR